MRVEHAVVAPRTDGLEAAVGSVVGAAPRFRGENNPKTPDCSAGSERGSTARTCARLTPSFGIATSAAAAPGGAAAKHSSASSSFPSAFTRR